ncbi:expressed unknown protein [Seminavis robusta]|uniref:Uncharacterized protein n=1 Tax=Seminavis robusta TaxID=568900 RepID=A0A9N8DV22_9STRA|nr:expressed unknown protein [Seminavis robusta]|eukprot:Sro268_g103701.1  (101) ;mRNA; f:42679-42981
MEVATKDVDPKKSSARGTNPPCQKACGHRPERLRDNILRRLQKQMKGTQAAYTPYAYGRDGLDFAIEEEQGQADDDDDEMSRSSTSTVLGLYYYRTGTGS